MNNKEFIDTLLVCGKLEGVQEYKIKELEKAKINIKEIYTQINKIAIPNNVSDEQNRDMLFNIINTIVNISEEHVYEGDFMDVFHNILEIYKLKYYRTFSRRNMALIKGFQSFNTYMPYRLDKNLREYRIIKVSKAQPYHNKSIDIISYKDIISVNKKEYLAYIINQDTEYGIEAKEDSLIPDLVDIVLKEDYDVIFIPYIRDTDRTKEEIQKYIDNPNIDNETFFKILRILIIGQSSLIPVRILKYLDIILLSKKDYKKKIYDIMQMWELEEVENEIIKMVNELKE